MTRFRMIFLSAAMLGAVTTGARAQQEKGGGDFVVSGKEAPSVDVAFWTEGDKQMVARGTDAKKAPAGAVHVTAKVFNMGGLMLREVRIPKGAKFTPPPPAGDVLIYLQSGKVKISSGGLERQVNAGDAIREVAGRATTFNVTEAAVFIETPIPTK